MEIYVTAVRKNLGLGLFLIASMLHIGANAHGAEEAKLPAAWIEPSELIFHLGSGLPPPAQEATVSLPDTGKFGIGRPYYDHELFTVEHRPGSAPRTWILSIRPNPEAIPPVTREYPLVLETNVPKYRYLLLKISIVFN